MTAAVRIRVLAAVSAVVVAAAVIGVVVATGSNPPQPTTQCKSAPQPLVVPGVPSTRVAAVRAAFAGWPGKTVPTMEQLARYYPNDAVVQFNYGVALLCRGYLSDATTAFQQAKTAGRNTFYEMRADEILHPQYFQPTDGLYPLFQPVGKVDPLLTEGLLQQRQGHQHSAERLYAEAAKRHPDDAQAQVAAAVGLFNEDDLSQSFSRLGPLAKRFPHSQSVHFHLGLLSAWIGLRAEARTQFAEAVRLGPATSLGKQAATFVSELGPNGTAGAKR